MSRKLLAISLIVVLTMVLVPTVFAQDETEVSGTVSAVDEAAGTITVDVENEDGTTSSVIVNVPDDFDFASVEVGDEVEVEGTPNDDGSIDADKIDVDDAEEEGDEDGDAEGGNGANVCSGGESHPVADGIAETYGADADDIIDIFCGEEGGPHVGFGVIMLAFQTAEDSDLTAEELLALKDELGGWGKVWMELGLIGRPEDAGPPEGKGRPVCAGPPDERPESCEAEEHGPGECTGPPDERPESCEAEEHGPPADRGNRPEDAGPPPGRGNPNN